MSFHRIVQVAIQIEFEFRSSQKICIRYTPSQSVLADQKHKNEIFLHQLQKRESWAL